MMILLRLYALLFFLLYTSPGLSLESGVNEGVSTPVETATNEENDMSTSTSDERISAEPSDEIVQKRHVHNIVDKLLGEENEEAVQSGIVSKQVQGLQNDIKILQSAMDNFLKAQGSMDSRARKLYSRVNQAFSDYFGEEVVGGKTNSSKLEALSKKKKKSQKKQKGSKRQIFTVKKNAPMVNSYLKHSNGYKIKSYGTDRYSVKSYSSTTPSYPVKSYGKGSNQKYTVKKQFSIFKNKQCCGR